MLPASALSPQLTAASRPAATTIASSPTSIKALSSSPWRLASRTAAPRTLRSLVAPRRSRLSISRASEDDKAPTSTPPPPPPPPAPQQQDPNELPWVRREREEAARAAGDGPTGPPFAVFLVASALVAIAAVGSVFEFVNKNAIFGVLPPESPLYAPILGLFALTGLPSAGWLFFKAVKAANEEAERQDKVDGFK